MPAPLLVSETLIAEGAGFLAAADGTPGSAGSVADARLARRLPLLRLLLVIAHLSLQRALRPPAGVSLAQVRRELAATELALRAHPSPDRRLIAAADRAATMPLRTTARLLAAEFHTIAVLARAADDGALFLWARRRAQMYRRTGDALGQPALRGDGATTRTRSRGTSSRTSSASASTAATRGKVVRSTRETRR